MTLPVYIGWDQRDALAYKVCAESLKAKSSIPLSIRPLKDWELREKGLYHRPYIVDEKGQMFDQFDGKPFSTAFSFTRFCVPLLENFDSEIALYMDADMLVRSDIGKLVESFNTMTDVAVACVKHSHAPTEAVKMWGVQQTTYLRKNWSSLMMFRPWKCTGLTKYAVNGRTGSWLHGMCWAEDKEIGDFDQSWNWLAGYSDPEINPDIVHYTLGTPDIKGREGEPFANEWWDYANR